MYCGVQYPKMERVYVSYQAILTREFQIQLNMKYLELKNVSFLCVSVVYGSYGYSAEIRGR